jgi:hypothetical protein
MIASLGGFDRPVEQVVQLLPVLLIVLVMNGRIGFRRYVGGLCEWASYIARHHIHRATFCEEGKRYDQDNYPDRPD